MNTTSSNLFLWYINGCLYYLFTWDGADGIVSFRIFQKEMSFPMKSSAWSTAGHSSALTSIQSGSLAQGLEHWSSKPGVVSSNLTGADTFILVTRYTAGTLNVPIHPFVKFTDEIHSVIIVIYFIYTSVSVHPFVEGLLRFGRSFPHSGREFKIKSPPFCSLRFTSFVRLTLSSTFTVLSQLQFHIWFLFFVVTKMV